MGFPQCVDTRAEILNMLATAWVGTDVRHHGLGASQLRSMKATGLLGTPPRLRPARPSFLILRSPIPDRHELIEVNCIPDEYSGYLEGAGPEDRG